MKKTLLSISLIFVGIYSIIFINDFIEFKRIMKNNYNTPYHENSLMYEPYTYIKTKFADNKIYWTENAVGDKWLVKDSKINDKVFWTILEKIPTIDRQVDLITYNYYKEGINVERK